MRLACHWFGHILVDRDTHITTRNVEFPESLLIHMCVDENQ